MRNRWSWGVCLVLVVACRSASLHTSADSGGGGETTTSGGAASSSAGAAAGAGAGGEAASEPGVALSPVDGWIDGSTNSLGVQGAVFAVADATTERSLVTRFEGGDACIQGTAAKVDLQCQLDSTTADCFDAHFGAILGLNLSQERIARETSEPQPFDATRVTGFAFELEGPAVPMAVRFGVETEEVDVYCMAVDGPSDPERETTSRALRVGLDELVLRCFARGAPSRPNATSVKTRLVTLRWQVVTNTDQEVPFDFCVKHLRALTD